ncbi:endolytic transglycosylase MltG [Oceanisphaera psychrotolerans]|uniref:Endolytic murein transglycosylase n=1 Tax=Oceanisphaera psychrotolerans TaxID=1414654 RepID=A0A1J4Q9X5_9GAMM|nr:endolytic transglycosylase MltG [Oceanisphaera psychrotolerans]OIN04351.1 ABC transporter substrate-binding protein [Oceanisphaera psychrotolerans]
MKRKTKWLGRVLLVAALSLGGLATYGYQQWQQLEQMTIAPSDEPLFVVARGETTFRLINRLSEKPVPELYRRLWLRFHPELAAVRQGTYKFEPGTRLREALMTMVNGDVYRLQVTLVEGLRLSDWLQRLAEAEYLDVQLAETDTSGLAERLGLEPGKLEGLLLPETYSYTPGDTDISILQRAHQEMERFLENAWASRDDNLPIDTPYEALILASIIEKETGIAEERPLIASVFVNRLRRGMRLQTDPTVIYGMGDDYDGNIRKRDLQTHTPYNTYVIQGLPPTPIAMPSKEAIMATLQPADSKYYYFVASGEGRHHFSKTLREHNNAVRRYILNR